MPALQLLLLLVSAPAAELDSGAGASDGVASTLRSFTLTSDLRDETLRPLRLRPAQDGGGGATGPALSTGAADRSAAEEAEAARLLYLQGDHAEARAAFEALLRRAELRGDVDRELQATALVYLGEMAYFAGDRPRATENFRAVLMRDPDYRLSEVDHNLDVIGLFDTVRTTVRSDLEASRPATRPLPAWGFAPFGIPQFGQQRPVRGAIYLVLQTGLAAASVASWATIDRTVRGIDRASASLTEEERRQRLTEGKQYLYGLSIPSASLFYVTWAISIGDGATTWRKGQVTRPLITLAPTPGGAAVDLRMRF